MTILAQNGRSYEIINERSTDALPNLSREWLAQGVKVEAYLTGRGKRGALVDLVRTSEGSIFVWGQ